MFEIQLCIRFGRLTRPGSHLEPRGHDQRRPALLVHAAEPARVKKRLKPLPVTDTLGLAYLHRHTAARAGVALIRPGRQHVRIYDLDTVLWTTSRHRLHIARKERRHDGWTRRSRPTTLTARARKSSRTEGCHDVTGPVAVWGLDASRRNGARRRVGIGRVTS
jgi:hypothetical protein